MTYRKQYLVSVLADDSRLRKRMPTHSESLFKIKNVRATCVCTIFGGTILFILLLLSNQSK